MAEKIITIHNQLAQLEVLAEALESISDEWNLAPAAVMNLNLVLEELITNVIFYGYDDTNDHLITVRLSFENDTVQLQIEDDGREFNPLLRAEPDISGSIEERNIGGLGIHFVRKIMDEINYLRLNEKNILTLNKNLSKTN